MRPVDLLRLSLLALTVGCSGAAEDDDSPSPEGDDDAVSDDDDADDDSADDDDGGDDDSTVPAPAWTWPVAEHPERGLALNDTFGPRIQTSQGRYDFHRGIDISRDVGTPVVAVAAGEVRIAGEHPNYRDPTVQILHTLDDGSHLISHYTHLSAVEAGLEVGDLVELGDPIALTGQGSSSYPHLHFELRRSNGTTSFQRNAVHPLMSLPYADKGPPDLTVDAVDRVADDRIRVDLTISVRPEEVDLVRVAVDVVDPATGSSVRAHSYDMHEWNAAHPDADDLDQPELDGVLLAPEEFNDWEGYTAWVLHVSFLDLEVPGAIPLRIDATASDVAGATTTVSRDLTP